MANSADPDQLASSDSNRSGSGSTLFFKGRTYPGPAGQGLMSAGFPVNLSSWFALTQYSNGYRI